MNEVVVDKREGDTSASSLERMVYHTDARVTAMEGQLSTMGGSINRIEHALLNKQPPNLAAWVGIVITIFLAGIGGLYGIAQYISLTQSPILDAVAVLDDKMQGVREYQRETHYEFGVVHERKEYIQLEIDKLWDHIHKQEDVDALQNEKLSAIEEKVSHFARSDIWTVQQLEKIKDGQK